MIMRNHQITATHANGATISLRTLPPERLSGFLHKRMTVRDTVHNGQPRRRWQPEEVT